MATLSRNAEMPGRSLACDAIPFVPSKTPKPSTLHQTYKYIIHISFRDSERLERFCQFKFVCTNHTGQRVSTHV